MPTLDDVARHALVLPETDERSSRGNRHWAVRGKHFVWERPLGKRDLAEMGAAAPDGPVLGASVEHEVAKRALIEDDPAVFFTTSHFDGYAAILLRLDEITEEVLEEVVIEAWLCRAPKRLAAAYLEGR